MKTIDLHTGSLVRFTLFPDNQPHIQLTDIVAGDEVQVIADLTSSVKLIHLLQTANALDHAGASKKQLVIPYLLGARYDRIMQPGDSFDLEVIAGLINSCGFAEVLLFDVHSAKATELINNAVPVSNKLMVQAYEATDAMLICPDAGAARKMSQYQAWNSGITGVVYCEKKRDLSTGRLTLHVNEPERCTGRPCVIIDDICDGGATFLAIAEQVKASRLSLVVSHGIFSKGFSALEKYFDEIICSNSLGQEYQHPLVKTIQPDWTTLKTH
jgi:ribose-phosphate pyrophosphokinase